MKPSSDLIAVAWLAGFACLVGSTGNALGQPGISRDHPIELEVRGLWVTRWDYQSPGDVREIIHNAARAGFNQVYFQVRAAADAYYRSTLEPWAARLSGKLGTDPGWDPLEHAVDEAHLIGLELHAWINLATAWTGNTRPPRSLPVHILRRFPRWRVKKRRQESMPYANGYVFVSPTHPGFQAHIEAVVAEIVGNYAVDGLHLDYARYPAADTSFDRMSNRLFRKVKKRNPSIDRAAWQRAELTRLVKKLGRKAKQVRPGIVVSAAVCGIYKNHWGWSNVVQGYHDFYQDSMLWARTGAVDILIPMMYWMPTDPSGHRADFLTLAENFAPLASQVKLLAGINVEAGDFAVLARELQISRQLGYAGVVLFTYRALKERDWFISLSETLFRKPETPSSRTPKNLCWHQVEEKAQEALQTWSVAGAQIAERMLNGADQVMLWLCYWIFDGLLDTLEPLVD